MIRSCFLAASLASAVFSTSGAVLSRSDVVFMYQADHPTYTNYGATVLAWGGKPTPQSRAAAPGVKFFGSVGMVTEFSRYYERFPQTYDQALCRDIDGNPVKVPWLTDHQHKGIPYWWCCTQQPQFRQYISERVVDTVKAGADGVHIDDHLGTAGGLWLGVCFCDRCVEGFRGHLKSLASEELQRLGVEQPGEFDFRAAVKAWIAADTTGKRKPTQHPLWHPWSVYQYHAQAAFMMALRELAAKTAGRPVPIGANAGLLWPRHLSDYRALDLFSAETDHHAATKRFSDAPLFAYRMADAVGRPYAATASGGDWAFIKEQSLPGLVRGWIALSYGAGHCLMAPHRQWCHTPEKGTHWYQGPAEKFAPLYQFVRRNAEWLDSFENHAELGLVVPHRAFAANPGRWFQINQQLSDANLPYRVILGGDEIVNHPLPAGEIAASAFLLIPDRDALEPTDRQLLDEHAGKSRTFRTPEEALAVIKPAVKIEAPGKVRAMVRVKPGAAVIHLLNYGYDAGRDDVQPLDRVKVQIDLTALKVPGATKARLIAPDAEPAELKMDQGRVEIPALGLWAMLVVEQTR